MSTSSEPKAGATHTAKITSKGQITIPVEVRRRLGVKAGDQLRFEFHEDGFRVLPDLGRNVDLDAGLDVFEKWRGIGSGFPIQGVDWEAVVDFVRELRGHDDDLPR